MRRWADFREKRNIRTAAVSQPHQNGSREPSERMSITTALKRLACLAITLGAVFPTSTHAAPGATPLKIQPSAVQLDRPEASEQLQVLSGPIAARSADVTRAVRYLSSNPGVATV